jgi:tetratricopeptide (TPR) repeat protein
LSDRYTRREVARILGVEEQRLAYWERLRLVKPRARWGQRFYHFGDLVVLRTIQGLAENKVPVRRLHRALRALEERFGERRAPLSSYRVVAHGKQLVFVLPGPPPTPVEPLSGQLLIPYVPQQENLRAIAGRSAEEWFETGLKCDGRRETLRQAVEAYRHAVHLSPQWTAAHINLGAALYQLGELAEARASFETAATLSPQNATAQFNLGCVLDDLDDLKGSMQHLEAAVRLDPRHGDAHFNLALALEKNGQPRRAIGHWEAYLKLQPRGPWSDYARLRLRSQATPSPPIPFPRSRL